MKKPIARVMSLDSEPLNKYIKEDQVSPEEKAMLLKNLHMLLGKAVEEGASDVHFISDSKPYMRRKVDLTPIVNKVYPAAIMRKMLIHSMSPETLQEFYELKEVDYAYRPWGEGGKRFRVNVFTAQNKVGAVLRVINETVLTAEQLRLPDILNNLASHKDGLILVSGATGSGKSTSLAAMLDYINKNYEKRIFTIENPVEVVHTSQKSLITQREVGEDTMSFAAALRSILRQNPDIILIGEIRDKETADSALQAAQTGHLVFSTIHAGTAEETVQRFAGLYPAEEREALKKTLAYTLRGIIAQRLVMDVQGNRAPVLEIMTLEDRVMRAIVDEAEGSETAESLTKVIAESNMFGMKTMDQHLMDLVLSNTIDVQTALSQAINRLKMKQEMHQRNIAT